MNLKFLFIFISFGILFTFSNVFSFEGKLENYGNNYLELENGKFVEKDLLKIINSEIRFEKILENNTLENFKLQISSELSFIENKSFPIIIKKEITEKGVNLYFNKSSIFILYFSKKEEDLNYTEIVEELGETSVILLLIFVALIFFVFGFFLNNILLKFKLKKESEKIVPSYVLTYIEKKIVEVLKLNPGINQRNLGVKLNISKSQISKLVSILESKKIIKKEKFGRNYKVFLNKNIL